MTRVAVILVFGTAVLLAQSGGVVMGRVMAEGSRQTLKASVTGVSSGGAIRLATVPTDDAGAFSIQLAPGRASIVASADGFVSEQRDITVRAAGGNPHVNFSLSFCIIERPRR